MVILLEYKQVWKGSVWLTPEFPVSLGSLFPILEIVAPKKEYFAAFKSFIMKLPTDGFPIKIGDFLFNFSPLILNQHKLT